MLKREVLQPSTCKVDVVVARGLCSVSILLGMKKQEENLHTSVF